MLMSGGWNVFSTPHHFDCTFHSEWMGWGRKQTIRFINVGLVSLMNSFCSTFSACDIGKWLLTFVLSSSFTHLSLHLPFPLQIFVLLLLSWPHSLFLTYCPPSTFLAFPFVLYSFALGILSLNTLYRHWPVLQLYRRVQGPGSLWPLLDAILCAIRWASGAGLP